MINWLIFGALGLIWGSSFLMIKTVLTQLDAFSLVSARLGLAALAYIITFMAMRKAFPRDLRTLAMLCFVGVFNTALPFVLISWGEQSIDSGLAGVLNGTTPLFSLVIAHLALHDDKITLGKLLGLIAGFAGVVLLALRSIDPNATNSLEGQVAVLAAACCYAVTAVFIRRYLRNLDPLTMSGTSLMFGAAIIIFLTVTVVRPTVVWSSLNADVVLSLVVLALLNTFVATTMYFGLLSRWGASRSTMVTYLVSPVSLLVGAVFGNETLDAYIVIGAALVIGGIALANLVRPPTPPVPLPQAANLAGD